MSNTRLRTLAHIGLIVGAGTSSDGGAAVARGGGITVPEDGN